MSGDTEEYSHDTFIISRSIENVIRKLIRFGVGRVSLLNLMESFQTICVEESERKLRQENPGQDASLTELATLTGMDTKTLAEIRNRDRYSPTSHREDSSMKLMIPENCVLDIWTSSSEFIDPASGNPKKLELQGEYASFERLVEVALPSQEVSAQSILATLVNNQAAKLDQSSRRVELLKTTPSPYKAGNQAGVFEFGMLQVCGLLDTINHNFEVVINGGTAFFDRGCWTNRLSLGKRLEFREQMREFLKKADGDAWSEMEDFEEESYQHDQLSAGVFMYYFEQEH